MRIVFILTVNNVLLLIEYITNRQLSACLYVGLLLLRLTLRSALAIGRQQLLAKITKVIPKADVPDKKSSCPNLNVTRLNVTHFA